MIMLIMPMIMHMVMLRIMLIMLIMLVMIIMQMIVHKIMHMMPFIVHAHQHWNFLMSGRLTSHAAYFLKDQMHWLTIARDMTTCNILWFHSSSL